MLLIMFLFLKVIEANKLFGYMKEKKKKTRNKLNVNILILRCSSSSK